MTVADADQALASLDERLTNDVQSARAEFEWSVKSDGLDLKGDGSYLVQSPGNLSLEAHYRGKGEEPTRFEEANDSELLVLAEQIYLRTPPLGSGWVLFTPAEFNADWLVVQSLLAAKSPLDFRSVTLGKAIGVDRESISDEQYTRITTEADAGVIMNALANAYGSQGQVMLANRFNGVIKVDLWIAAETLMPRRFVAEGDITFNGADTRVSVAVDFEELNTLDDFPSAPSDANPFAQLGQ